MIGQTGELSHPPPLVVEPRQGHKQSMILLHGRGGDGQEFGTQLLISNTTLQPPSAARNSKPAMFASMFPETKFIFPTARERRSKWYDRVSVNQWFDSVPISEQDAGMSREQEEWQLEGLKQSREMLKSIVDEQVKLVGAANVFIGGYSQGCAMAFHLLLSYEGSSSLGGFVGWSGWLPFAEAIETIMRSKPHRGARQNTAGTDCPYATSNRKEESFETEKSQRDLVIGPATAAVDVCNFVRDNMGLPPINSSTQPSWLATPMFLGHGAADEKVALAQGLRASRCLEDMGVQVIWNEYGVGHALKVPEEIDDIVDFVHACL